MATPSSQIDASQFLQQEEETGEYENAYQVYKRLIDVVINETIAPEVLPFEEEIIEFIVEQVQDMQDKLTRHASTIESFCGEQHRMELERFRFVINKYYRTRLEKIEKNASNLVKMAKNDRALASKILSDLELRYLDKFVSSIHDHLKESLLHRFPDNMRSFELEEVAKDEKLENNTHYVFVKAVKKTSVMVDDPITGQEVVEMEKGSQHFLPFSAVRPLLLKSSKDLILL